MSRQILHEILLDKSVANDYFVFNISALDLISFPVRIFSHYRNRAFPARFENLFATLLARKISDPSTPFFSTKPGRHT